MTRTFLAALIFAAMPAAAAPKIKSFKRLIVCAVAADPMVAVGLEKDGKEAPKVNAKKAIDEMGVELETKLQEGGIAFVPFAEANAAAVKVHKTETAAMREKTDASAVEMGKATQQSMDAGMSASMQAVMNNPNIPPNVREQMLKAMSAPGGAAAGAGAALQAKAGASMGGAIDGGAAYTVADAGTKNSKINAMLIPLCNRSDEKGFQTLLEEFDADGWLYVSASFGGASSVDLNTMGVRMSSFIPAWTFEAKLFDKKGKMVWQNRRAIETENLKMGKTVASAAKAVNASGAAAAESLAQGLLK